MNLKLVVALLFLTASTWCAAFESWEHKRMGDLAYHLALTIYCANNDEPLLCRSSRTTLLAPAALFDPVGRIDSPQEWPSGRAGLTYGDIVACVDFFLTTEKLIAGRESTVITGTPPVPKKQTDMVADETARAPGLFPYTRSEFDLSQATRCHDSLKNGEGARAQHVNHSHFQVEAIAAQRTNHMLAIDLRTREENVFAALVLNAISDHYLQDTYAPGHIGTWRSRLTDLAANAYHDERNRRGMDVSIMKEWLQDFAKFQTRGKFNGDLRDAILEQLHDRGNTAYFFQDDHADTHRRARADSTQEGITRRLRQLEQVAHSLDTRTNVFLRGDDFLWDEQQDEQRYLMLLTNVRAILDVLESRKINETHYVFRDSFRESAWAWNYEGQRESRNIQPSTIVAKTGPVSYKIAFSDDDSAPIAHDGTDRYIAADTLIGISVGVDSMTFGDTHNRTVMDLETPVMAEPVPRHDKRNFGLLAGVQPFYDSGRASAALTTRAVWVYPETEFALSIQGRAMRLATQSHGYKWRPALGVRMDAGFTSFVTFYLQTGFDAAVQSSDSIRRGWAIGAGVQIAAPKCRIPLIKAVAGCD